MRRLKLAILISGRGSNMEALLEAAAAPSYPAEPVLVASNRPDAKGARNGGFCRHCYSIRRSQTLRQGPGIL
jgi:folate-dependent phosphoribosylglycinamide formyltransferase PurN